MNVLTIAAHPDDEVLGVGGTMARLAAEGHRTSVLILAEGVGLRHPGATLDSVRAMARAANEILGTQTVYFGGLNTDNRLLDEIPSRQVVQLLKDHIRQTEAEFIFTHFPHDIHSDHRLVAHSTFYAVQVMGLSTIRKVMCYETLSSTEQLPAGVGQAFEPNLYYDVAGFIPLKVKAMACYTPELQPDPHPRSPEAIEALARYRGVAVGMPAAEAFVTIRELI